MTYVEEAGAYIRVSHQEAKLHGLSLDAQVEKITEYAEKHHIKIVEWYRDEGVSGRKLIKNRPELQRMIHDAQAGRFKRILFIKLDRFFRSVAEYHECMKLIDPVIWTATEEKYDLSTANGRAFVNMKLTIAELEADTTGERIKIVNDYKVKSGLPLFGTQSMPFCYAVVKNEEDEKHKTIAKQHEEFMEDVIAQLIINKSVRQAVLYARNKHNVPIRYKQVLKALKNPMIYGTYRDNPNYCEPYVTRETFEYIQAIIERNPRTSNKEHTYIFAGLIPCPVCGRNLVGAQKVSTSTNGTKTTYYTYRCPIYKSDNACSFTFSVFENTIQKKMLATVEDIIEKKKIKVIELAESGKKVNKYNLEELQAELERLNYAWKKGRIKSVEEYDLDYDSLMEQIEAATAEIVETQKATDFSHIHSILETGWKGIYENLDDNHRRAFWRSFVDKIHLNWSKDVKEIADIEFF